MENKSMTNIFNQYYKKKYNKKKKNKRYETKKIFRTAKVVKNAEINIRKPNFQDKIVERKRESKFRDKIGEQKLKKKKIGTHESILQKNV